MDRSGLGESRARGWKLKRRKMKHGGGEERQDIKVEEED